MRFAVRFLRHRGRIIPWRMVANQPAKIGDLRIEECRDEELHRYVRAAKLFAEDTTRYSAALPMLLDVRLISMSPQSRSPGSSASKARSMRNRGWSGRRAVGN